MVVPWYLAMIDAHVQEHVRKSVTEYLDILKLKFFSIGPTWRTPHASRALHQSLAHRRSDSHPLTLPPELPLLQTLGPSSEPYHSCGSQQQVSAPPSDDVEML